MPIQGRLRYDIIKLMATLYGSKQMAGIIAGQSGLNTININFSDTALINWDNIITEAENSNMLPSLLERVIEDFPQNRVLLDLHKEILFGIGDRIEIIAKAIKYNKCVLFIGPEILLLKKGNIISSFNEMFATELSAELKGKSVYFDELKRGDNLFYIAERFEEMPTFVTGEVGSKASEYFIKQRPSVYLPVYEKISELPFPIIINTNPDSILCTTLNKKGIQAQSAYYDISNTEKNTGSDFNLNQILIYQIFGSFENPFSILFTERDNVKFTNKAIKKDPEIPNKIIKALEDKYYLFIGFSFQEWRLKILIDILGLGKIEKRSFALSDLTSQLKEPDREYFEKEYKFYFITNGVEDFLEKLVLKYKSI